MGTGRQLVCGNGVGGGSSRVGGKGRNGNVSQIRTAVVDVRVKRSSSGRAALIFDGEAERNGIGGEERCRRCGPLLHTQ